MTNKEMILMLCEAGKNELEKTFAAVPDDKLNWKPAQGARSALDAFGQAAQSLGMAVALMEHGQKALEGADMRSMIQKMGQERAAWSRQEALTHMETGWSHFKAALEPLTDEQLNAPITMPFGGGTTAPLGFWVMTTYRNLVSRFAQINYIQTLYGDNEMH